MAFVFEVVCVLIHGVAYKYAIFDCYYEKQQVDITLQDLLNYDQAIELIDILGKRVFYSGVCKWWSRRFELGYECYPECRRMVFEESMYGTFYVLAK